MEPLDSKLVLISHFRTAQADNVTFKSSYSVKGKSGTFLKVVLY